MTKRQAPSAKLKIKRDPDFRQEDGKGCAHASPNHISYSHPAALNIAAKAAATKGGICLLAERGIFASPFTSASAHCEYSESCVALIWQNPFVVWPLSG